tara:strand:+ start:178 stop:714 length:537 start_codon:yes stop_codon:yes gene_type:complete
MKVIDTKFKGLKIIQQKRIGDSRGSLRETFRKKIINWDNLIFDYATSSRKNVIRGFHFQSKFQQAKFVTVLKGEILDYVVDLRKNSKTFGKSLSIVLSEANCKSLYIPEGFGHAYYSYSNLNIIYYKLSNYYQPKYEDGILWNDKSLKFKWPTKKPIISKKDKKLKTFADFKKIYKGL